jgi:hypothetical protein
MVGDGVTVGLAVGSGVGVSVARTWVKSIAGDVVAIGRAGVGNPVPDDGVGKTRCRVGVGMIDRCVACAFGLWVEVAAPPLHHSEISEGTVARLTTVRPMRASQTHRQTATAAANKTTL